MRELLQKSLLVCSPMTVAQEVTLALSGDVIGRGMPGREHGDFHTPNEVKMRLRY